MSKITLVKADDWQGLYLNDVLVHENHSIRVSEVGQIINDSLVLSYTELEVSYVWMETMGHLPPLLSDIPKDVIQ